MTVAAVVRVADVPADRATGARVRTLLDIGSAGQHFVRRHVDVEPRSPFSGTVGSAGELWFVIDGTGRLDVEDHPGLPLRPDQGLWLPSGAHYLLNADGPAGLRFDAVSLPSATGEPGSLARPANPGSPLTRDLRDCEAETTGDRQFRVLFGPGLGCPTATQFAGEIPPGRAPVHSHPYDELVLVLEGEGVRHLGGSEHAVASGTCAHLPPGQPHCLKTPARPRCGCSASSIRRTAPGLNRLWRNREAGHQCGEGVTPDPPFLARQHPPA